MTGLRIGGLASGMDIDSLVEKLMTAERIPLDKLTQKKTTTEWQRDSYRAINTKLKTFDTYLFDNFSLSSNFNKKTATSSNESAVSVSANSTATGSIKIDSVSRLAVNATGISSEKDIDTSKNIKDVLNITGNQSISFKVFKDGKMVDSTPIEFNADTTTVSQFISKVNSSNAGVSLFYDDFTNKFSISSKSGGGDIFSTDPADQGTAEVQASSTDAKALFEAMGFTDSENLANGGSNASLSINGVQTERYSNTFSVNGLSISLKATTSSSTTVSASADIDSMVDKVKEFVEKYNELITGMNDSLKEKNYRDYAPLSDEQRKDMSESEQKLWDEKARSGLLRNDSIVSGGLSDMRNAIYGRVGSDTNVIDTLAEMGITTSSVYSDGGKLVIDEKKLRTSLTENPDKVVQTLTQSGSKSTATTEDTRGIIQRLRDSMTELTRKIEIKAGKSTHTDSQYSLGKSLIDMNNRITAFQRRLEDVESRYWKQFTAMETAINKANSQSSYLSGFGQ